ncbi:MAG: 30S ribosomal protein S2 [Ignavibacteria bacterium]|nr:30S ribosomal protein S2 [Ignavibacteria bacterium]
MKHYLSIEQLLESGAHFGHLTRRWNPKMDKFIFGEKNGIHLIDLRKTQILIDYARDAVYNLALQGKSLLMVGTKPQAQLPVERAAKRCGAFYVTERWLGGMLTNFTTIRKSIKRLNTIDKMELDGTFDKLTKKERLHLVRERERLRKFFGGIEEMIVLPSMLYVVDIKKEHIAVKEAQILNIPVVAIVDTNCDPELVDYVIPANDDSQKTIDLITSVIADAYNEGKQVFAEKTRETTPEVVVGEIEEIPSELSTVKTKLRPRKAKKADIGVGTGGITPKIESLEEEEPTSIE